MDYGNELNELIADGWSYRDAVEWFEFITGEEVEEKN
jgi:hypothetical protein